MNTVLLKNVQSIFMIIKMCKKAERKQGHAGYTKKCPADGTIIQTSCTSIPLEITNFYTKEVVKTDGFNFSSKSSICVYFR